MLGAGSGSSTSTGVSRPTSKLRHGLAALLALGALTACAKPPPVIEEAEALAAQGKLDESADRLALACAFTPTRDDCAAIDRRVAERRLKAAEKALTEGRYAAAERALRLATLTDAAEVREAVAARLGKGDLAAGRRYELALLLPDRKRTHAEMVEIAKLPAPEVSKLATQWIERERPAILIADVKETCSPGGEARGSCAEASAALRSIAAPSPERDAALALARAEEARVYPLRLAAERLLPIHAAYGKLDARFATCLAEHPQMPDSTEDPKDRCRQEVFAGEGDEKREKHDVTFENVLAEIRDPALVKALRARAAKAVDDGKYTQVEIPKPEGVK
jgi:hypothetical protein